MPSTPLNTRDTVENKTGKALCPRRAFIIKGETDSKQIRE